MTQALRLVASGCCLAAISCARTHVVPDPDNEIVPPPATVATIVRPSFYPIMDLAARNEGRLYVVLRQADHPTVGLASGQVSVRTGDADRGKVAMTDSMGVARFDSLPIGEYQIEVRRIGVARQRLAVTVIAGCETDVEIYAGIQALGLGPPPAMATRMVITTCPRER